MAGSNIRYGMGVTQEVGLVRQADLFIKFMYFFFFFLFSSSILHIGWLGIKHQFTNLLFFSFLSFLCVGDPVIGDDEIMTWGLKSSDVGLTY